MVACWTGITMELHPCVPIHNASLAVIPTEIFHDIPDRYMFIYTYVCLYNIYIYKFTGSVCVQINLKKWYIP